MTTILRKSDSSRELRRKLNEAATRREPFDPREFVGKVAFNKEDGLTIQKRLRAEWDERPGVSGHKKGTWLR